MKARHSHLILSVLLVALLTIMCGLAIAESTGAIWLVKPSKPTGWVNLRTEPSLESEGLARATLNQEVTVIEDMGEWAHVIYDGEEGYMMTKYLEKAGSSTSSKVASLVPSTSQKGYEMKLYTEAPNPKSTVSIQYPYFNNNDALNSLVQKKIKAMLEYPSSYYPQFGFTADYKSTVTLDNDKMVSICFIGSVEIEKGKPGTVVDSLNVDLSSMREIKLSDLYRINEDFESVFFDKAYYPTNAMSSYSAAEFPEVLYSKTRESSFVDPFAALDDVRFYLKTDGIVISIPASGTDYLDAQLNYTDIQQFYLPSQNYW